MPFISGRYINGSSLEGQPLFTQLESPAACSGDKGKAPFVANTGFKAPCEPSRWKEGRRPSNGVYSLRAEVEEKIKNSRPILFL